MRALLPLLGLLLLTGLAEPVAEDGAALRVAELRVVGLGPDSLSHEQIQELDVRLLRARGGYVAPRPGAPGRVVRLRDLRGPHGAGTLLRASAVQAILDRVVQAHEERGFGEVGLSVPEKAAEGLRTRRANGTLIARFDTPGRAAVRKALAALPAAPAPELPGLSDAVLVNARAVSIEVRGVGEVRERDLLGVTVELGIDEFAIPPGFVAPRPGQARRNVTLWSLGGPRHEGTVLYGSAVQTILDTLRRDLDARGFAGAEVSLTRSALRRLSTPHNDGLLMLEVRLPR